MKMVPGSSFLQKLHLRSTLCAVKLRVKIQGIFFSVRELGLNFLLGFTILM